MYTPELAILARCHFACCSLFNFEAPSRLVHRPAVKAITDITCDGTDGISWRHNITNQSMANLSFGHMNQSNLCYREFWRIGECFIIGITGSQQLGGPQSPQPSYDHRKDILRLKLDRDSKIRLIKIVQRGH